MNKWEESKILTAAFSTGDANVINLALQLTDNKPCPECDYVIHHCRCDNENLKGFVLGYN